MNEQQASNGVTRGEGRSVWRVKQWVRDCDLEGVLNGLSADGWKIVKQHRNTPGNGPEETTTVVAEKVS